MNSRLIVDQKEGLKETDNRGFIVQPPAVQLGAKIISYIFHPLFIPVYIILFLVYIHPYLFAGFSAFDKTRTVVMTVMMYSFFPLITVIFLKALKFIETIQLEKQKDRIIPLVASGIWYFWIWYVWKNLPEYPQAAVRLALGIWMSVTLALFANITMKVSLHAISMGVLITFLLILAFTQSLNFGVFISIAFLIAGLVCTSRFIVSDHTPKEVYSGFAIGVVAMLIGQLFG